MKNKKHIKNCYLLYSGKRFKKKKMIALVKKLELGVIIKY